MQIDLDETEKSEGPPWDLTLKHQGKTLPVKMPSSEQLVALLGMSKKPAAEGYANMVAIFQDLTGIQDQVSVESMLRFFTGLAAYIGKRVEKSKIAIDQAAAAAVKQTGMPLN